MIIDVKDRTTSKPMFLAGSVNISRNDKLRYPFLDKLNTKQLGFFWQPEEVEIAKDYKDFKLLTDHEKHIFTSNLKRQILLDSVQGRAPVMAFGPICSNPELETWLTTWTFFEMIHSRSYSYLIKNVYPNPGLIFDTLLEDQEIVQCSHDITRHYDRLIENNESRYNGQYSVINHKYAIWNALMAVNILEGLRFYVSFACSWAFAEVKKMEGNAKIIKLICRDENLHLASTQQMLKVLAQEDKEFEAIRNETIVDSAAMFIQAVDQEKVWAHHLFKDGSIIGLNEKLLVDFIEFTAHKRMVAVGLQSPYKIRANPLPWTQKWISGNDVQVAPQETQVTSYVGGGMKKDVESDTFKGFTL